MNVASHDKNQRVGAGLTTATKRHFELVETKRLAVSDQSQHAGTVVFLQSVACNRTRFISMNKSISLFSRALPRAQMPKKDEAFGLIYLRYVVTFARTCCSFSVE